MTLLPAGAIRTVIPAQAGIQHITEQRTRDLSTIPAGALEARRNLAWCRRGPGMTVPEAQHVHSRRKALRIRLGAIGQHPDAVPRHNCGVTLVEILVGMAILGIMLLPLVVFQARAGDVRQVRDLHVATALLRGETSVLFATHAAPEREQTMVIDGRKYSLTFEQKRDGQLLVWRMAVAGSERRIAQVQGLLFAPEEARDGKSVGSGERRLDGSDSRPGVLDVQ